MPDDRSQRASPDDQRIDINDAYEVQVGASR